MVEFVKTSDGPVGVGTTYRGVVKVAGKDVRANLEKLKELLEEA